MRESNFEKQPNREKEPIIDIEVDKETLEKWKELEESDAVAVFEDLVKNNLIEPGDRISLHPLNFEITSDYDSEDGDEEDLRKKVILNYTFAELGFNPKDYEMIREEGGIKFFKTNRQNILLAFDGIDWWLELRQDSEL